MAEPFLGEVRMFGFNWPPRGWALCNGERMPSSQNPALYALIGSAYGGDPQRTYFNLPDLRGRVPVHRGGDLYRGLAYGFEYITLVEEELPTHTHGFMGNPVLATNRGPAGAVLANAQPQIGEDEPTFVAPENLIPLASGTVSSTGGGQGHINMQPSLVVNFCIALDGQFPPRPE